MVYLHAVRALWIKVGAGEGCSMVESSGCSSRGPRFDPQNMRRNLQLCVTSVLGYLWHQTLTWLGTYRYACRQNTHTHNKIKYTKSMLKCVNLNALMKKKKHWKGTKWMKLEEVHKVSWHIPPIFNVIKNLQTPQFRNSTTRYVL